MGTENAAALNKANYTALWNQLIYHEDLRLHSYPDTEGIWTIGVGHTKNVHPGQTCTREQALKWFDEDLNLAVFDARNVVPNFLRMGEIRRAAFINLLFNLGATRFLGFERLRLALEELNWRRVAAEMVDSKWMTQVGRRAGDLVLQVVNDSWWVTEKRLPPRPFYLG